jgi:hypothetical protein
MMQLLEIAPLPQGTGAAGSSAGLPRDQVEPIRRLAEAGQ